MVYAIWKTRNMCKHGDVSVDPFEIFKISFKKEVENNTKAFKA
jgi:hypothetical protein